jgi:hypothetical protein
MDLRITRARVAYIVAALGVAAALGASDVSAVRGADPGQPLIEAAQSPALAEGDTVPVPTTASPSRCVEVELPYEMTMGRDWSPPCD